MKIALCFSGHMRTYANTYAAWYKHVLNKYNPDIYIHSWSNANIEDYTPVNITDVQDKFAPVSYVFESYVESVPQWKDITDKIVAYQQHHADWRYLKIFNEISAFRKVYLSNHLLNGPYDLVIQSRADILLHGDIVECTLAALERDENTFAVRAPHPNNYSVHDHSIAPEVTIGRHHTIRHFSNIYPNLSILLDKAIATNSPKYVMNTNLVVYEWMIAAGHDYTSLPTFDIFEIQR